MAALEHRRTESEFVSEPTPGRSATLCRADDLKLFMQQLSDQIADADRRHSGVLRDMLERLSRLGGQTETLKASLPKEFSADLERLEDGMASLAQRIAESDQARRPETIAPAAEANHLEIPVVQPSTLHALPSSEAEPEPAPALNWSDPSRAAFLTSPPALRSAVNAQSSTAWSRPESIMQNNGQNIAQSVVPSVGQSPVRPAELPHAADAAPAAAFTVENSDDPWDSQSAEALTKLYDSGEPGLPPKQHVHDVPAVHAPVLHASVAVPAPVLAPVAAPASVQMPGLGLVQGYAPVTAARPLAPAEPAREQIEREWLDARLNDIAARVEQSLADLKPENSLADIGRRFDQLEERWTSALGDVATRSDVEGLRLVEAHIAELTTRLEETQTQLARLDAIEAQIAELGHQLTDEQVVRLFGNLIPTEADLTHFAEQASEKVAARLLADMPAPQAAAVIAAPADTAGLAAEALDLVQAAHADSTEQIGALQKMLAGFIDERRRGEAETAEALETMQHAMQHVLDRVDALDMARPVQSEARADEVAAHGFGHKLPGMPQGLPAHGGLQAGYVPGFAPGSVSGSAPGSVSRDRKSVV